MGLTDIIEPRWLKGFDSQELRMLVGGVDTEIDIDDLQANTVVSGLPEHTERGTSPIPCSCSVTSLLSVSVQRTHPVFARFATFLPPPP
jgi:hypothetical protein